MATSPAGMAGTVIVVLADGETRAAALVNGSSYLCPWCDAPVLSPEAWQDHEQLLAEDRQRCGDPALAPHPYPPDLAAAWNDAGCPSPACVVSMTAGQLAAWRERQRLAAARQRDREAARQLNDERQQAQDELWERLASEAAAQGACLRCLRRSPWTSGSPTFTRRCSILYVCRPCGRRDTRFSRKQPAWPSRCWSTGAFLPAT